MNFRQSKDNHQILSELQIDVINFYKLSATLHTGSNPALKSFLPFNLGFNFEDKKKIKAKSDRKI